MPPIHYFRLIILAMALFSTVVCADEVEYAVSGVGEPMLSNVLNHVSAFRVGSSARLNSRLRRKMVSDAEKAATDAMRPYGYFNPVISVEISREGAAKWLLSVNIQAGPPVTIVDLRLELTGPGNGLDELNEWYQAFPLAEGEVLNQQAWDRAKLEALEIMEQVGYLQAEFSRHSISVDPVANTARLELVLETGPQAVLGAVTFNQDILHDGVLDSLQRFEQGDAYNFWLLEKFRLDLWRSGYFEDIEVVERRELTATPPRVDLSVNFKPRKKNTYQGTIGFGTDTLIRGQLLWGRHILSPRGDNFDAGFGWQQKDNEFTLAANYRLPRKTSTYQYWVASLGLKSEKQTLEVSESGDLEHRFSVARGTVNDYSLKMGKTRSRNMQGGFEQLFETMYIQYLHEDRNFELTGNVNPDLRAVSDPEPFKDLLKSTSNSWTVGLDWDWPEIRGSGFHTIGHHERAWIFTSNDAWGSDLDYSQVYLSSRWNFLAGKQWKFLLRAEAGYSDADTIDVNLPVDESELKVSVTELPGLYRFKAGGSRSVRGYAFELLDNNGLGSNNILTASAEVEYHFHEDWSAAVFIDVGNAFNDWSKPDLKLGSGIGVRWYSVIGALRVDVAQGWDLHGDPWRIHLTIGTPLL
jgi:translocation and assembly module TamA